MIVWSKPTLSFRVFALLAALFAFSSNQNLAACDHHPKPDPTDPPTEIGPVCQNDGDLCVTIFHDEVFNSNDEAHFKVHIIAPENSVVEKVKVKLWMNMGGHGHGSSPVKITKLPDGDYQVDRAYFVMSGRWLIKVGFQIEGSTYAFELPVDVE